MDRYDRVDYQFYGFIPQNEKNENDIFIQYFNHRYQAIMNSTDEAFKKEIKPLQEYLHEIKTLQEKKQQLINILSNPQTLEKSQDYKEFVMQHKEKELEMTNDDFEIDQTLSEYVEKDNLLSKINKQINEKNALQKAQSQQEIKNLQKNVLKMAWRQLYYNPDISQAKQCYIQVEQLEYYLLWLYFALHEMQLSQEVNECTIQISNQMLTDQHIEKIYSFVFQVINQCDNIIVFKLLLNNNKLTMINKLLLLFPRNITHLTLDLKDNQLQDSSFIQFYIPDNIQILTLDITNNSTLTTQALKNLCNNIHPNLELELYISESINKYDVLIDYIGKCHSLKINDKQIIYNPSFMLEVQIENLSAEQFLTFVTVMMKNINFEQQPISLQDKAFSFTSREIREKKKENIKSGQLINLEEDNKDRCNQIGSHQQLSSQQSQFKNKSQKELDTNKHSQQQIEDNQEDDDDDDVDIIEKKDFVLQVNGIKILDTQDDYSLTLNLSQFDMSIFEDRNLYNWIGSLPKIPSILQVKNYEELDEKNKTYCQIILSRKENNITINEQTFDMKKFILDFTPFLELEYDYSFLMQNLQLNNVIEELEISVLNSENSVIVLRKIIQLFDSSQYTKLRVLKINTDENESKLSFYNPSRKYSIVYNQLITVRKESNSIDSYQTEIFQLNRGKSISINQQHSNSQKKKLSLEL